MINTKFLNRMTGEIETEKVYGANAVNFLYNSSLGKMLWPIVTHPFVSAFYGVLQDSSLSKSKISPFVENFSIDLDDYLPAEDGSEDEPYKTFNDFFIRKFKPGKRTFKTGPYLPAFAEARYLGWNKVSREQTFPVKGEDLQSRELLGSQLWGDVFNGGPLLIARLCPVDYHRFHYPDDGAILDRYRVGGDLHSVNPLALKFKSDIFCKNERIVSILDSKNFGKLAYIEVGATCVGKIIQSHDPTTSFLRGEEKGYFLFGGSTVILMGEPGSFKISPDIAENTIKEQEVWVPLGDELGDLQL